MSTITIILEILIPILFFPIYALSLTITLTQILWPILIYIIYHICIWFGIYILPVLLLGWLLYFARDTRGLNYTVAGHLFKCSLLWHQWMYDGMSVEEVKVRIHALQLRHIEVIAAYLPQPLLRATPAQLDPRGQVHVCKMNCVSLSGGLCENETCPSYRWCHGRRVFKAPDMVELWAGIKMFGIETYLPVIQGNKHVYAPPGYYVYEGMFHFAAFLGYDPIWGTEPIPIDKAPSHIASQFLTLVQHARSQLPRVEPTLFSNLDTMNRGLLLHIIYLTVWIGYITFCAYWWFDHFVIADVIFRWVWRSLVVLLHPVVEILSQWSEELVRGLVWVCRIPLYTLDLARDTFSPTTIVCAYYIFCAYLGSFIIFVAVETPFRHALYDLLVRFILTIYGYTPSFIINIFWILTDMLFLLFCLTVGAPVKAYMEVMDWYVEGKESLKREKDGADEELELEVDLQGELRVMSGIVESLADVREGDVLDTPKTIRMGEDVADAGGSESGVTSLCGTPITPGDVAVFCNVEEGRLSMVVEEDTVEGYEDEWDLMTDEEEDGNDGDEEKEGIGSIDEHWMPQSEDSALP